MKKKVPNTTLLFLYKPKENKILLAMKKRRFGTGKWNGVGGKLEKGESIKNGLIRETKEEIDVVVQEKDLVQVATLDFSFENKPEWDQQTHVFMTKKWKRVPIETEEMKPKWFKYDKLPFGKMWIDDIHWLPLVLKGKKLKASFHFSNTGDEILNKKIKTL